MPLSLNTVQGYVADIRALLLDKVKPYRYSDVALVAGLNLALLEGRRIRPDLFVTRYGNRVPQFTEVSGEEVPIEEQFRLAFVYGTAGHVLLRDEEDVQDARAKMFTDMMHDLLQGKRPTIIPTGTPPPANPQK